MNEQLNAGATSESTRVLKTIRNIPSHIHFNKADMRRMNTITEDLVGLKLPDICLICEENPEKTSPRKRVPTGDRTHARCVTDGHATA